MSPEFTNGIDYIEPPLKGSYATNTGGGGGGGMEFTDPPKVGGVVEEEEDGDLYDAP